MLTVEVPVAGRAYPVHIGADLLTDQAFARWRPVGAFESALIVTDSNVGPLYGDALEAQLDAMGASVRRCTLRAGEKHKNFESLRRVWDAALAGGADRGLVIVALGGGVVGDIAGFAAATALRGVRLVQVPTSLLAMVDSSVGGKTAVNHERGKNLVGAFKQPKLVIADVSVLQTLPPRELCAGFAEAVKHGAVLDADLLDRIERDAEALLEIRADALLPVIARCCELKAAVVSADEREAGPRRVLNFGHTVGHAIERVSGYGKVLHGEAVAIGMIAALRIGELLIDAPPELRYRMQLLLDRLELPSGWPKDLDPVAVAAAVAGDKKRTGSNVAFVLCPQWGAAEIVSVPLADLPRLVTEASHVA